MRILLLCVLFVCCRYFYLTFAFFLYGTYTLKIVYLLVGVMGRITGPDFATLALIMAKSGANVQIESNPVLATGGQEMCKINVVGSGQGVGLAGQMIQEVRGAED